jgi:hypothetical protein
LSASIRLWRRASCCAAFTFLRAQSPASGELADDASPSAECHLIAASGGPHPASGGRARRRAERHPSSGKARSRSSRGNLRRRHPSPRHKRNNGDRRDEGAGRAEGDEEADSLVPESQQQQGSEGSLRDAQEVAGAGMAKGRIQLPDQRSVTDERDQPFEFIWPPVLVTEEEKAKLPRRPAAPADLG